MPLPATGRVEGRAREQAGSSLCEKGGAWRGHGPWGMEKRGKTRAEGEAKSLTPKFLVWGREACVPRTQEGPWACRRVGGEISQV